MSQNIYQVFQANPITTNASTDLMYFGQSPYGTGNDAAMTYANFSAQFLGKSLLSTRIFQGNGSNVATAVTLSAAIDAAISNVQGGILYRSATGWSELNPTTSGYYLTTNGAAANPSWTKPVMQLGSGTTSGYGGGASGTVGNSSLAFGPSASATGANSFAFGNTAQALALNTFAFGGSSTASNQGSFSISDGAAAANDSGAGQFNAGFAGGFYFLSSSTPTLSNPFLFSISGGGSFGMDSKGNLTNYSGIADASYDYQTPTTGFSHTIGAGVQTLIINPSGTLASGTITMPAAPVDGQRIQVGTTNTITALTVSANSGQTIKNAPTTLVAGNGFGFEYKNSNSTWFPLYQPSISSGGSSPWTSGAGTGSAIGGDGTCTATGSNALSYGSGCVASNSEAVALGLNCTASGLGSVALGYQNSATATASFACGGTTQAKGSVSFAFGSNAQALSVLSVAFGQNAISTNRGSFVLSDSQGTGNTDSLQDQYVATYAAGFYNYVGITLAQQIDTTGAVAIRGASTNNNATAGFVGELIFSEITTPVTLTTATSTNITSISLTAGDWDIEGFVAVQDTLATITQYYSWISTTSATPPNLYLTNLVTTSNALNYSANTPFKRLSLATTTTVYLSANVTFASGTVTAGGGIYARRRR